MLEELKKNLENERGHCENTSVLYEGVFRAFIEILFTDPDQTIGPCRTAIIKFLEDIWGKNPTNAWFERPLLLAAALHKLVRARKYLYLTSFYSTCGGDYKTENYAALKSSIIEVFSSEMEGFFRALSTQTLQTNEISRGIAPLSAMAIEGLDANSNISIFEIGCSAGLNLIADKYGWAIRKEGSGFRMNGHPLIEINVSGNPSSCNRLTEDSLARIGRGIKTRRGCDINVVDVRNPEDVEMLQAMIWGDHGARMQRLDDSVRLLQDEINKNNVFLFETDGSDAIETVTRMLLEDEKRADVIVFYNTVVTCYFDDNAYSQLYDAIEKAFSGPLQSTRCLWIEHEPKRKDESALDALPYHSYIKVRELGESGKLVKRVIAGVEMHPSNLVFLDDTWLS